MNQVETIIVKAMSASKAWPAVFEAGSAAELAHAAVANLDAAGFAVVPKEPMAAMIAAAAPLAAHAPGQRDFETALAALKLLPPTDYPDVADVLAQLVVDYRAMIEARLK